MQNGLTDLARFQRVVKMVGFLPFTTAENALENMNSITEHELSDDLKVLIQIVLLVLFIILILRRPFYNQIFLRARKALSTSLVW